MIDSNTSLLPGKRSELVASIACWLEHLIPPAHQPVHAHVALCRAVAVDCWKPIPSDTLAASFDWPVSRTPSKPDHFAARLSADSLSSAWCRKSKRPNRRVPIEEAIRLEESLTE